MRQAAIKKHIQTQRARGQSQSRPAEVSEGDQFHDGREVLDAVINWHKYLRSSLRRTDTLTSRVLDLVDEEMLLGPADRRINASDLCSKLDSILEIRPPNSEPQLPDEILVLLGEVDEEATCKAANLRRSRYVAQASSTSSKTITRDALKSSFVERPLKTTHRQSFWPDQSLRLQDGRYPENQQRQLDSISEQPHTSPETFQTPQKTINHYRLPSDSSSHPRSRRPRYKKRHPPQNYFQACEEIKKREHERKMEILKHPLSKKDSLKDELLTSYFGGTRDIVGIPVSSELFIVTYIYGSQIFLVDNAESMNENWYEATQLLTVLVKKAAGLDPDGMDLRFTTGNITLDGKDSASKFVKLMDAARPKTLSKERARTDLRRSLGNILHGYLRKVRENERRPVTLLKDTVLLVLTDGIWAGMENKEGVAEQIKTFSKELKNLHYDLKLRPFSVEFIQFGNNDDATQRLRYLDDYLHKEGIP